MTRPSESFLYKVADPHAPNPFVSFIFKEGTALALPWQHVVGIRSRPPGLTFVFAEAKVLLTFEESEASSSLYWPIETAAQTGRLLWVRETQGAITFNVVEAEEVVFPNPYLR